MTPDYRFYYLHNFQRALDWIGQRHADLLDAREQDFLRRFPQLPQPSQALLVRLLMRRGPWFRAARLQYDEIPDIAQAAAPLLDVGWLQAESPITLDELFALFTKPELRSLLQLHGVPASARKAALREAARVALEDAQAGMPASAPSQSPAQPLADALLLSPAQPAAQARPLRGWAPQASDTLWRVAVDDLCERLRLMFFGNLRQDWSEFVLADLGVFRYETVSLEPDARAFQRRADIDGYLAIQACRQAVDDGAPPAAVMAALASCASANPWLERRRAKVLWGLGQHCERARDWDGALSAYAACDYPGARQRRIRVLEQMGRMPQALHLANETLAAPSGEAEAQAVSRMLPRLRRALGEPTTPRVPAPCIVRMDVLLPRPPVAMPVELVVRDHLWGDETPVHYVENTLVNALFGLLCWPAIFAPVPGAFFHPFQSGPADLNAPDFLARRQGLFDACLARLDHDGYRDDILRRFDDKSGIQSPFVAWGSLSRELLQLALDCLPARHLKHWFLRMLQDLPSNRSGWPDLIRFWPAQRRYELIEVKGPGDKLQDSQIRWLRYCVAHDMPVRVCHVRWQDECPA